MYKQSTPIKIWNSVCDANVELFRARMNYSAEMFDLYTKWPRQSFSDATEALKAAHLESLKILAEKADKPAAKAKAAPKKKAKPVKAKKAQPAPKGKPVAAQPEARPKTEAKVEAIPPKVETKPAVVMPKPEAVAPKPVVEAVKPAAKAAARPVTLPEMPDFTAKPRPTAPAEAPKPAEAPEKDG